MFSRAPLRENRGRSAKFRSCRRLKILGRQARKKAVVANGPKFREETPKKGSNAATPIAVLHCKK